MKVSLSVWLLMMIGSLTAVARAAAPTPEQVLADADAAFLKAFIDPDLADGFDFPIGDANGKGSYKSPAGKTYKGWYVAVEFAEDYELGIHTGEDWNGVGGGDTDLGQPVYSIGNGKVIYAEDAGSPFGNIVVIKHQFLENGKLTTVFSQYDHLKEMTVKKDDSVKRRAKIGTIGKGTADRFPAHLHIEIRKESMATFSPKFWPSSNQWTTEQVQAHYESPTAFINARRKLLHPATTPDLMLAVKHRYQLHRYQQGNLIKTYEIALSQKPLGHKLAEGDLKLPEGFYHIVQKATGPFEGEEFMKFLGAAWLRIDYPNNEDAAAALAAKTITRKEHDSIVNAHLRKKMPPQNTTLGGGIGIHGWVDPGWNPTGNRDLTWGCISLNKDNLLELNKEIKIGTPIVIIP